MKCVACGKESETEMCDICELGLLEATAKAAVCDWADKVNKILKEKQNEFSSS